MFVGTSASHRGTWKSDGSLKVSCLPHGSSDHDRLGSRALFPAELASNSERSACLCLLSAGIIGVSAMPDDHILIFEIGS